MGSKALVEHRTLGTIFRGEVSELQESGMLSPQLPAPPTPCTPKREKKTGDGVWYGRVRELMAEGKLDLLTLGVQGMT